MKYTIRRLIQLAGIVASIWIIMTSTRFIAHQYCPYALVCFGASGLNPQSFFLFVETIIAGLILLVLTLIISRVFCGFVCPFGTLSEYINYLNPFRKKTNKLPPQLDRKLKMLKYLLLVFNLVAVGIFANRIYNDACPIMTITKLSQPQILIPGIFLLGLIMLMNILIVRFWCRYLCPYAALMNCLQFIGEKLRIPRLMIRRNLETCTDCLECQDNCQMNIDILDKEDIDDSNCIFCLNCMRVCQVDNALAQKIVKKD